METLPEIFFIPGWSEETLLLDLNLHITNLYEGILKMQALIGLKQHINAQFIHQWGHRLSQTRGYISNFLDLV